MITLTITEQELAMIRECLAIAAKSSQVPMNGMKMIAIFDEKLVAQSNPEPIIPDNRVA